MIKINFNKLTVDQILDKAKQKGKLIDKDTAERLLRQAREHQIEESYDKFIEEFLYNGGSHFGALTEDQLDELHAMGNGVPDIHNQHKSSWEQEWFYDNLLNSSLERKKKIINTTLDFIAENKPEDKAWGEYTLPIDED